MATESATAKRVAPQRPFGAPHVYVLAVVEGPAFQAVHRISSPETIVGREDEAGFTLDDSEISKRHLVLRVDGPTCLLSDLDSLNGTKVNGRPLRPGVACRLHHLDEIRLGGTRLLFLSGRFAETRREE